MYFSFLYYLIDKWFAKQLGDFLLHTTLANSITLTPGTVTLNVTDDGLYEVHALNQGFADGLLEGGMQQKIAELFGEPFIYEVVEEGEVQ